MIRREAVRTTVKQWLYSWILQEQATPGLPLKLSEAAARLGVSVTPVREALIELETEGLVTAAPGRGFVVTRLSALEAKELYPLIWTLETMALSAAPKHSAVHLMELEELNQRLTTESENPAMRVDLDNRWHETLLRDSPHEITLEVLATLKRRVFRYEFKYMESTGGRPSTHQHDETVAALREGRRDMALAAVEANWRAGLEVLEPWLERLGDERQGDPEE